MGDADLHTAAQALSKALVRYHPLIEATQVGPEVKALRAALAAATEPPKPNDFDVIWTCPPCRRDEHQGCLDAGPGVCLCARRNHGAAGPVPDPRGAKRWTFDVNFEGGPQPVDYGTGTEWDGSYQWAIYDGPHEIDGAVLAGAADEDPTPVLTALVAEHNQTAERTGLLAQIEERRNDPEFMARIRARIDQDSGLLVRLAAAGAPDEPTDDEGDAGA